MRATTNQPNPAAVVMRSGSFLAQPLEFLSFTLGQDKYGIDIQKIQELRDYDTVTRIVNAPKHTKGVVDSVSDVIRLPLLLLGAAMGWALSGLEGVALATMVAAVAGT
jgi:hypothetical protein